MSILQNVCFVSGAAGFIGYHVASRLLLDGYCVVGIDNLNEYYDVSLKYHRIGLLSENSGFLFYQMDILDKERMHNLFNEYHPQFVIHLAAQAGVRYSLENRCDYINSNIIGFFNIIDCCKEFGVQHFLFASSSSVYGNSTKIPFKETDLTDKPISLYAATKKSNEIIAYTYSYLYGIPITAMRFFTVYGPLGRPDMSYFCFTKHFFRGEKITVYQNPDGKEHLYRDFTYIDDVVEAIDRLLRKPPMDMVPFRVLNIGNSHAVSLAEFIGTLEECLSKSFGYKIVFDKEYVGVNSTDAIHTCASTDMLRSVIGFVPTTVVEVGLRKFSNWYYDFYYQNTPKKI